MKLFKAAAGAAIACILCAGMSVTALAEKADTSAKQILSAGGESFEINYSDSDHSEDAGYLKYRHKLVTDRMNSLTPSGRIKADFSTISGVFGTRLSHDSRFDGMKKTYFIDVSQWQYTIDWKKVKADGIDNVIIRLGYRGYGSAGTLMMDDRFYENIKGAKAAGLKVGIYFYTQAITYAEARQEADFCAAVLKDYTIDLPVYYDIESVDYDYGRLDHAGLSKAQKTKLCRSFCDRIESYGYESGVYANLNWLTHMINGPELGNDYRTWVACYDTYVDYPGIYDAWQYSSSASIDGIKGGVDISVKYDVSYAPVTKINAQINNGILSWNKAAGADGYTVYGSDNGSDKYVVADVEGTSFDISNQKSASYCVAAYNYFGGKKHYGSVSAKVDSFREAPASVQAKRSGIDKATLSWDAVDGAVGYEVYTSVYGVISRAGVTKATSFEISGSQLEKRTAVVRAYNKNGIYGDYSEVVSLPSNAPSREPHAELRANKLLWTSVPDADGYVVTRDRNGTKSVKYVSGTSLVVDESVTADYYVQAYTELDGEKFTSAASNICSFKGISYPPRGNVELDSSEDGLSWNKIDDAMGYVVYEVDINGNETEIGRTDVCSYHIDDPHGAVYFVKAYNTKEGKEFFTEASNRVKTTLPEVTEAALVSKTDDYAVISWNAIEGCSEYMVYVDMGHGYKQYSSVKGEMAIIVGLKDADFTSVRIKGYVGNAEVVNFGLFSNQLYIIGDEKSRPADEVFYFDDLLGQ